MNVPCLVDPETGKVRSLKEPDPFEGRRGFSVHELDENLDPVRLHAVCASGKVANETAGFVQSGTEAGYMGIEHQESGAWNLGRGWFPTLADAQADYPDGEEG